MNKTWIFPAVVGGIILTVVVVGFAPRAEKEMSQSFRTQVKLEATHKVVAPVAQAKKKALSHKNLEPPKKKQLVSLPKLETGFQYYSFGLTEKKNGEYETALRAFDKAIDLNPDFQKAHTNRARLLLTLDMPNEAFKSAKKAVALNPEDAASHNVLGRAFHQLGVVDKAIAEYREAVKKNPDYAWAYNNLGLLHIQRGEYEVAELYLREAMEIDTEIPIFYNNLAIALEHQGKYDEARHTYKLALYVDPDYSKAISSLSRIKGVKDKVMTASKKSEEPNSVLTVELDKG